MATVIKQTKYKITSVARTSLTVQWLRLCAFTAGDMGWSPCGSDGKESTCSAGYLGSIPARSQHGESRPRQRSWGRGPGKRQRLRSGLRGTPGFSWASTPKTRVCLLYCTVLSTLLTFSGKKLTQGFSLLHMKGMFQLKPLWWLSNLPDRFNYACDCLWPPNRERHAS